jgi:hypothetical protein
MIKMKTAGPWRQIISILNNYPDRLRFVRVRIGEDVANAFVEKLKELAPSDEEYSVYLKSLKVVRLITMRRIVAFAVVSSDVSETIGEIVSDERSRKRTVVYIEQASGAEPNPIVDLLSMSNPWSVYMLPNGIPRNGVTLVHQIVTDDEVLWAEKQASRFISKNRGELRSLGISFGKIEDPEKSPDGLESLPDYMSLALRSEFGINADPHPHWRPAIKWVQKNLWKIVKGDEKIKEALGNWLFREHKRGIDSSVETMSPDDFKKKAGRFQKKVMMNG